MDRACTFDYRQQVDAIERIIFGGFRFRCSENCRGPVHRNRHLTRHSIRRNHAAPPNNRGHTNAAFQQVTFVTRKRPLIRESFAAIVTGEDHQRVPFEPCAAQRLQHATNASVHALHHGCVNLQRAAIHHRTLAVAGVPDGLVFGAFPRRMRRRVMETEIKRLVASPRDEGSGALRQQLREISDTLHRLKVFPKVGSAGVARLVCEVVTRAAQDAEELFEPVTIWSELRFPSEMPLANERRVVTVVLQQRGDRRVVCGKALVEIATSQRLV